MNALLFIDAPLLLSCKIFPLWKKIKIDLSYLILTLFNSYPRLTNQSIRCMLNRLMLIPDHLSVILLIY